MRLIDADALMEEIKLDIADVGLTESLTFYRIMNAPTIDADRPQGKWHHIQSVCYGGGTMNEVVCSKCHEHYILPTNFCPYCGSDNREE